jgi:hypothetical protein
MPHKIEYKPAKFHFTDKQIHKIKKREGVRVAHHQIGKGPHVLFLHPHQHHKLSMNHAKGKGMDLAVTDGELMHTIESGIAGTGIWDNIKSGLSTAWKYAKPVVSGIGDAIAYSNPELAGIREGVRNITGVGLKHKHHHKEYEHMLHHEHEHHHKKRVTKKGNGLYL